MSVDYGSDVDGILDIDPTFRRITGRRVVFVQLARRFLTRKGWLAYAPNEGMNLRELLSRGLDESDLRTLQTEIALEAERDERIDSADCTVTLLDNGKRLRIALTGELLDGPFRMVLAIDNVLNELRADGLNAEIIEAS